MCVGVRARGQKTGVSEERGETETQAWTCNLAAGRGDGETLSSFFSLLLSSASHQVDGHHRPHPGQGQAGVGGGRAQEAGAQGWAWGWGGWG